ncbi:MAG: hypothetical protein ACRES8_05320 [Nevskiaceae bacterium]
MIVATRGALILLTAGLFACSDGGGNSDSFGINCEGLSGATATASVACTAGSCSSDFQEAAVDGDLGTYAILSMAPASAGSVSIRSTAADGVTYPAGTPAAVVYGIQRDGESLNAAGTLNTYLDGTLQETGNLTFNNGTTNEDVEAGRNAMNTNLDFDAIEVTYTQTGGTADLEVQVYEFCTTVNS